MIIKRKGKTHRNILIYDYPESYGKIDICGNTDCSDYTEIQDELVIPNNCNIDTDVTECPDCILNRVKTEKDM